MSHTIHSVGEHGLIDRLRRRAGSPPPWVSIGIGDDAAVIQPARGMVDVITADSLVEGVHFRREWSTLADVGYKALAVNLSDLAAMAAVPRAALLSLALPDTLPVAEFDALIDGFAGLADRERVPLVGGNLTRSPGPIVIDVTLVGAAHPRRLLRRDTAKAGDELYVTGALGAAATGLAQLRNGTLRSTLDPEAAACVNRYERPEPRLRCGVQVGRNRAASACVDLSDGLADAAHQLASASGTGVVLHAETLPVHAGARALATAMRTEVMELALTGGEDYELLFAVGAKQRRVFHAVTSRCGSVALTRIGVLTADPGCWVVSASGRSPLGRGFTHF